MKIAIDVRSLMEGRHTGVEEYTIRICLALQRYAPEHTYSLFYNAARPFPLPPLLCALPVQSFRYPNKIFNGLQALAHWPRWDHLVAADCFFVPTFRLLPVSANTPVVTTVHDLSFERFPEFFSLKRRLWHRFMQPRRLMEKSARLIAVSRATAHDVASLYGIAPDKITVVHSGIDALPVTARSSLAYVRHKYHLPPAYLLYVGTLEPRKNITSIIRAFTLQAAHLPHHLVIAGRPGWLTSATLRAVAASTHRDRIHVIGFVDEADKWSLYAGADLFIYPSFYEGFGFPPLESLVAGTPVVTSYNSSLPEIVGAWATLVNPDDPAELAAVLPELLRHPQRVSPAVQQAILEQFSWAKTARQTSAVIESAAK